jgi:membrane protein YdbS with pleckstrin-like domain
VTGPTLPGAAPPGTSALLRWFRVPPDPPEIPSGRNPTVFRPGPGFLTYLRLGFAFRALILGVVLVGGPFVLVAEVLTLWTTLLGGTAILAFVGMATTDWAATMLRYDLTWYIVTDQSVRIRRGIWTIHEGTVTFENVQNVRVRQGPLQRLLGIADVVLETAAAGVAAGSGVTTANQAVLEGVSDARALRDRIAARMRRTRGGGLGDEAETGAPGPGIRSPARPTGPAGTGAWSPAHLAALREVLEAARALEGGGPGGRIPAD